MRQMPFRVGRTNSAASFRRWWRGRVTPTFHSNRRLGVRFGHSPAEPWYAAAASVQAQEVIPIDITEVVQAWVSGAPNHGVVTFHNDTTDGWQVCTMSHPEAAKRPKLSVTFTTGTVRVVDLKRTPWHGFDGVVEAATALTTVVIANAPANPIGLLLRYDGRDTRNERISDRP